MIFDRTQEDVNTAISLRDSKVKTFSELTSEELTMLEKGTVTINTLNRIEEKQAQLQKLFIDMGYWNVQLTNKQWIYNQIFNEEELQRIVGNLNSLKAAFFVYKSTPKTPAAEYHYENFNAIEKILYDMDVMINDVKSHYRICGTFNCGEA